MVDEFEEFFGIFDEMVASEEEAANQLQIPEDVFDENDINPPSLDTFSLEVQKETLRRIKVINFVEKRLEGGWTEKNLTPILDTVEQTLSLKPPSWRILAGWKKLYFESGRDIKSLIPKHAQKGNRNKSSDSQVLVDEAIEKKYLTKERLSIAEAFRYYKSRVITINQTIIDGAIEPISQRTFYDRVNSLPPYEVAVARYGKRYADREFRSVGQQIAATKPMEYVEIDHTPLPVILIDDELDVPLGRPYLTMLYDRFSKCVVGLSVNFRDPSFDSVRKALLNTLLDKSWLKESYPSIKNDWPCHGKIDYLVVDNGAEFWSDSLENSLRPFVTDILYSQAAKPWRKTGIEKLFDQLNKGLTNSLPGKTFTNPTQLKDYDPKKESVVRVSVFLELLHKWVVDYYHMSPDARERAIPYHKWHESKWRPNTYRDDEILALRIELGLLKERTIGISGIRLHNQHYQSDELIEYRKYTPVKSGGKLFVKTKTDPSDISSIYVFLESEKRYIKVPAVDNSGYTKGLSLFEHKRIQKVRKLNMRELKNEEALAETYLYIENRIEGETERLSRSRNKKQPPPKTGNTSKLAKFRDVGSDGPTSIVANEPSNNQPVGQQMLSQTLSANDEDLDDIEGY
ncbi:Mu transposase C-terminal domain-containing protein [Photobacterium damselae]|uniref:Mu transposase C-terminal domain-containing protein n=1 Tax=Photobacterium damselae TaxID=38293 RepID=UPI001EDD5A61|nr:Mu transposase C-terminal domain-containing protein [Photobacterium damselae]MCG3825937.1 transposase [Photobacterium damselae]